MQKNSQNANPEAPEKKKLYKELEEEFAKESPDIWRVLEIRKKLGTWHGDIKIEQIKKYNLSKGPHYYVVEDLRKRSVKCISCPVSHGGILEAHLLARYKVENGIIYLDGKPTNEAPKGFKVD